MAGYSKEELIAWMREQPRTLGWGAILAFNRTDTNTVLLQEYIERFSNDTYLPAAQGYIKGSNTQGQYITDYVMDYPRLSFDIANVEQETPDARLTMKVVGGTQVSFEEVIGGLNATRVEVVDPLNGPELTLKLQLVDVPGNVDSAGKVVLDLKKSSDFSLSYSDFLEEQALGGLFFKQLFEKLPDEKRILVLNELIKEAGHSIKPETFKIRTQAAPGAKRRSAENYGDGAVLIFVAMKGSSNGGNPDQGFRYLIPDDADKNYSAAIVLGNKFILEVVAKEMEGRDYIGTGAWKYKTTTSDFWEMSPDGGQLSGGTYNFVWGSGNFNTGSVGTPFRWDERGGGSDVKCSIKNGAVEISYTRNSDQYSYVVRCIGDQFEVYDAGLSARISATVARGYGIDEQSAEVKPLQAWVGPMTFESVAGAGMSNARVALDRWWERRSDFDLKKLETLQYNFSRLLSYLPPLDTFLLQSLLFRNSTVRPLDVELPGDVAIFGQLAPDRTQFSIDPVQSVIGIGETLKFNVFPASLLPVTWQVESVSGVIGDAGSISPDGSYTAPAGLTGPYSRVRVIALRGPKRALALISVVVSDINVSPVIQTCGATHSRTLSAGTRGTGALTWSLRTLGNGGKLEMGANGKYVYTAPVAASNKLYVVDEIVVKNELTGKSRSAWIMAVVGNMTLSISRDTSVTLPPNQVKLRCKAEDFLADDLISWETLAGSGTVVNGIFTQPDPLEQRFALLLASHVIPNVMTLKGYILLPLPLFEYPSSSTARLTVRQSEMETVEPLAVGNSKDQLLEYMRARETTQDWGAICMFGRARLNRLLEQQFVAGFDEFSFLPAFSIQRIDLTDDQTEWMELDSIILSKPLLSFETASLDNSRATLKLGLMSGVVKVFSSPAGSPTRLLSSFTLSEPQGYILEMGINLHLVVGEVDARGHVTLDFNNGLDFSCNLGEQLNARNRIGEAFEGFLKTLPRHKRVFELGTLELQGYNPLSPTTFHIRTQAAPGAKHTKASNYGEGGVLIFIALRDKPSPGYFPGEGSGFPYFIPDDKDEKGNDLYSAALVLSHDMIQHVEPERLDLLNSLLFPGEHVFVESSRHTPKDLIVFGNIDPTLTSITLEPLFQVMHAGSTQQFNVRQVGKTIKAADVQWSVRSINTLNAAGKISNSGMYESAFPQQLGKHTVRNVVTATYKDPSSGRERKASALMAVVHEAITLAPQVSVHYMGSAPRATELFAVSLESGDLVWRLLDPQQGSLVAAGNQATYTPPATLAASQSIFVQRIEVKNTRTGLRAEATMLLMASNPLLEVTPSHVFGLGHSGTVQLVAPSEYPPESLRWSVTSGEGTVSPDGLFTAPAQFGSPTSVVRCEFIIEGTVVLSGYSVIQLSDFVQAQSWTQLQNFQLTIPAGQIRALGNGYQQIAVDVEVETQPVDGVSYPITEEEMSSLTIVHRDSGQALSYLSQTEEGIADDADYHWAVSNRKNRFNPYGAALPAKNEKHFDVNGGITRRRVYLHTRASDPEIFHARFIDAFFGEHNSNEQSQTAPRVIEPVPVTVPQFESNNYTFSPKRVDGGGQNPPEQNDYDYFLDTTDYWYLEFVGRDGNPVRFVRCEFEGNQSTVQWESRRQNETMFSYTGYIFRDEDGQFDESAMLYDKRLPSLMPGQTPVVPIKLPEEVGVGQLMISLFRKSNVRYVGTDVAKSLEASLVIKLLDKNGNRHHLSLAFAPMEVADSRNTLLLSVI
ncbi:hypothetical protein [Pseudomonas viridiflava]|uniref:hypothetical protein n=1 Tax=Pseudomonas viridiflava TaxID=33069 RepID=UPI001C312FF8|nr:hypothetical protein [Pseudomonas viridiflava]QXG36082.1 hypothetical protein KTT61_02350 [Pseudomonas viridiflava]